MNRSDTAASAGRTERMTSLHDVVLNYLQTHAFASTARSLTNGRPGHGGTIAVSVDGSERLTTANAAVSASDGMELDDVGASAGGSISGNGVAAGTGKGKDRKREGVQLSEDDLVAIERRQAILNHILNGAIMRAVDALNTHFPAVLDDTASSSSSNGVGSSNGHSTSPTTVSNLGRRVSSAWGNPFGASDGSGSYRAGTNSNGYSNGASQNGTNGQSSNGTSNGSNNDHALPVMHHSLHPAHVKLNLSIQAFIESFRQLAPSSSPSTPSSSIGSLSGSMSMSISMTAPAAGGTGAKGASSSSGVTLTNALTAAQGLHQEAKKLAPEDRAVYLQEIKDVGALLAYTDPETSILKGFLEQGRRIALADQVNKAILNSEGHQTTSRLEQFARRTTAYWAIMAEKGIDAQPSWTSADGHGKEQLGAFWKGQSKAGFRLRDFVAHSGF